jgi:RimJ/RimL family protein N-acetyltransferase
MKGPERIETARLLLRKPVLDDAEAVFSRYASDPEVTKYLAWPRHGSIEHTRLFLRFSDAEWERWPVGPYLIEFKDDLQLLGAQGWLSKLAPSLRPAMYSPEMRGDADMLQKHWLRS